MDKITKIKEHCFKKNGHFNGRASSRSWWEKRNIAEIYDDIMGFTSWLPETSSLVRRIWHYINQNSNIPACKNEFCCNEVNWYSPQSRYLDYCCQQCSVKSTLEARIITSIDRYGVSNPSQSSAVKEKIVQTMNTKYNVSNFSKTTEFQEKMSQLWKDPEYRDTVDKKRKEIFQDKFASDSPFGSSEVKQKIKKTLNNKYGVDSPLQSIDIRNKAKSTMLVRYGAENYNQSHLDSIFLENLRDPAWVSERLKEKSLRDIATENNMSYSNLCKKIRELGIDLTNYSYFEKELHDFLSANYKGKITTHYRLSNKKELDIFLPEINLAIECNGTYWHSEIGGKKDKYYHLNKTLAAKEEGIRLIHIFEHEWTSKRAIIESLLANSIGANERRLYARNCIVKKIETADEKVFLNENHLQGYVPSKICFGAYLGNELVALMSFARPRFSKKYDWELLRFSIKKKLSVVGVGSRLFYAFVKEISPDNIISYCDLRWFTGAVYEKLGFVHSHDSLPNYSYIRKNGEIASRIKYQKHKLSGILETFDSKKTEWENMQINGFDRFWDCGNGVWIWNKK